jgi:hypothetical protein
VQIQQFQGVIATKLCFTYRWLSRHARSLPGSPRLQQKGLNSLKKRLEEWFSSFKAEKTGIPLDMYWRETLGRAKKRGNEKSSMRIVLCHSMQVAEKPRLGLSPEYYRVFLRPEGR